MSSPCVVRQSSGRKHRRGAPTHAEVKGRDRCSPCLEKIIYPTQKPGRAVASRSEPHYSCSRTNVRHKRTWLIHEKTTICQNNGTARGGTKIAQAPVFLT